jgi:hypothetical protein
VNRELMRLAAALVHGDLRPEDGVAVATSLVGAGQDSSATIELASMSSDPKQVSVFEVAPLVEQMLRDFDIAIPTGDKAGWMTAGFVAEAMLAGGVEPATGALRIWSMWQYCGSPGDELTGMLQLHDAWEMAVGEERLAIETEMLDFAPTVIAAARRHAST